ncbi:hypothetical protein BpHYR1_039497 [Brachionus plicatilis]|uniref:Uncharacterized protein n=1 Tax=Brachionus plicatilis TaxID=10195 RepID=A0A3M7P9N5_BRAPC|nr:hypothetical protein BpHYR1_039497 [Brachionus plicatilis]
MFSELIISGTLLINAAAVLNIKFSKSNEVSFMNDGSETPSVGMLNCHLLMFNLVPFFVFYFLLFEKLVGSKKFLKYLLNLKIENN